MAQLSCGMEDEVKSSYLQAKEVGVAVKELTLSYYSKEALSFTLYTHDMVWPTVDSLTAKQN